VTNVFGPCRGKLSNQGDLVVLQTASGEVVDEVSYQLGFPWPTVGDIPGHSIELVNPALDNDLGGSWRSSTEGNSTIAIGSVIGDSKTSLFMDKCRCQ
jgi:hypothetical protein